MFREMYWEWACFRSEGMHTVVGLISTLDAIDFTLYFREQDIPQEAFFPFSNWNELFSGNSLRFDQLRPPIMIPRSLKYRLNASKHQQEKGNGKERLSPSSRSSQTASHLNASLEEENHRLRRALMMQINQRAYFQEEYSKSQSQLAATLAQLHQLSEERNHFEKKLNEQVDLVSIHEETNASLQRQLSAAFTQATERDQVARLRDAINHLSVTLEAERTSHRATKGALTDVIEEKARQGEYWQNRIEKLQAKLEEDEAMATDRIRLLTEQLKLTNSLKEEYKRQLSKENV